MKKVIAVMIFASYQANEDLLMLPGSAVLNEDEQLNIFEHAVNVTTFETVPVFGGSEYRE